MPKDCSIRSESAYCRAEHDRHDCEPHGRHKKNNDCEPHSRHKKNDHCEHDRHVKHHHHHAQHTHCVDHDDNAEGPEVKYSDAQLDELLVKIKNCDELPDVSDPIWYALATRPAASNSPMKFCDLQDGLYKSENGKIYDSTGKRIGISPYPDGRYLVDGGTLGREFVINGDPMWIPANEENGNYSVIGILDNLNYCILPVDPDNLNNIRMFRTSHKVF